MAMDVALATGVCISVAPPSVPPVPSTASLNGVESARAVHDDARAGSVDRYNLSCTAATSSGTQWHHRH